MEAAGLGEVPFWALALIALWSVAIASQLASLILGIASLERAGSPRGRRAANVDFVIVTKASYSVMEVLEETIERVLTMFPGYRLWVVVDEGSEGIDELRAIERLAGGRMRVVVVPKWYNKGVFKARALNYFVETIVERDRWYVFLDDDSYPLDDRFLYELSEARAPVYVGVLHPRPGRSLLAWLADAIRYHGEVTRNRFVLNRLGKPLFGLHGELLIVKGWVLKEIGFATDSIAEDTWFAARLIERGIRVAQSSSRVSILSPNSVVDLWRQRARWNLGVLRDILRGYYPAPLVLGRGLELSLWATGPLTYILAGIIAKKYIVTSAPTPLAALFLAAGSLVILAAYTIYPTITMGFRGLLLALAALPLTTFLEAHSVLYALAHYKRFTTTFVVVDKTGAARRREARPAPAIIREEPKLAATALTAPGEPGSAEIRPRITASRLTTSL